MKPKTNQTITFRINDDQREIIEKESMKAGLPTASFCRFKILESIKQNESENGNPTND